MVSVTMYYDEETRKWETFVTGVANITEAKQAFHAAMLTAQLIKPEDLTLEKTHAEKVSLDNYKYKITPFGIGALGL